MKILLFSPRPWVNNRMSKLFAVIIAFIGISLFIITGYINGKEDLFSRLLVLVPFVIIIVFELKAASDGMKLTREQIPSAWKLGIIINLLCLLWVCVSLFFSGVSIVMILAIIISNLIYLYFENRSLKDV